MEQLQKRGYTKEEISAFTGISLTDHQFRDRAIARLNHWGYEVDYPRYLRRGVPSIIITRIPTTADERLVELMYRVYGLDIQVEAEDFAIFLDALMMYDGKGMPWLKREMEIKSVYNRKVSAQRMSRWARKLIEGNFMTKQPKQDGTWWKTYIDDGEKRQVKVPDDEIEVAEQYAQRKIELAAETDFSNAGWSYAYKTLWEEYQCCYYQVGNLVLNGFKEEEIALILSWVEEIVQRVMQKQQTEPAVAEDSKAKTVLQRILEVVAGCTSPDGRKSQRSGFGICATYCTLSRKILRKET